MKKTTFLLLTLVFLALSSWKARNGELIVPEISKTQRFSTQAAGLKGFTPPARARGTKKLNVKNYGAVGNGIADDTDAFQKAIDALPAGGGTVYVPAGTYMITTDFRDVNRKLVPGNSIRLRSKMHLELSPDAILKAKPTDAYSGYIVYAYNVSDVEISGGKFVGERDQHLSTKGEYIHGIQLRGCDRVTIRDMHISKFWGDGVCIGTTLAADGPKIRSNDVVIDDIISTGNRRQGLSIGPPTNIQVWDSEFNDTKGTAPQCGIDIEPERGLFTENVLIQNCVMRNNHAYGILLYKRIKNATIKDCKITGNNLGIVCEAPLNTHIISNEIHNNRKSALVIKDSVNHVTVVKNTFYENNGLLSRNVSLTISGSSAETEKSIIVKPGAAKVAVESNIYK